MKLLWQYLSPHYLKMAFGLLIKFLGTIMDLLIPWILAYTIDYVIPSESVSGVFLWGGAMILCAIFAVFANITANRMASKVSKETITRVRHDLYEKIIWMSSQQIDDASLPSLVSRLTSDSYHVHHMIGMMQRLGVRAPILLVGGILITLSLDVYLAMILLFTLPIIGLLVFKVSKKGIPLYKELQNSVDRLVRTVRENIQGVRVIKALSKTTYEQEKFSGVNEDVVSHEKKVGHVMAITNPLMNLLLNIGLTLVVLMGAFRVNLGLSQPGAIIAFLTYFTLILNAMLSISRIFILYSKGTASFNRIADVLNISEDLTVKPLDSRHSEYHLEVNDVSFAYQGHQQNLSNITIKLKKGETLGIIGPTGSGKSTLIKLIMRFYDPTHGDIRIHGQRIDSMPKDKLHTKFGVVLQNDALFADTIAENIAFGRMLDDRDIALSSTLAQAGSFIDSLSNGYNHLLDVKGANLSGGQKQRLLISRALASKPEILILDDASSALDYKTDANLRRSLKDHFHETTAIIVAQRISSIMHANHILVLSDGQCVGYGSHQLLMDTCADYKDIYSIQMGGSHNA